MNEFKRVLKSIHILPLRRCDVIEYAKKLDRKEYSGICLLLNSAILDFNYFDCDVKDVFPLLTLENARIHGGDCSPNACENGWWWVGGWTGGREKFFQWLCEQYKDDKTKIK